MCINITRLISSIKIDLVALFFVVLILEKIINISCHISEILVTNTLVIGDHKLLYAKSTRARLYTAN